jgi:23S rRNA (adenine2030-N6)-methyltransferase
MVVINPPYMLHDTMAAVMPWLTDVLGQYDGAHFLIEHRAA